MNTSMSPRASIRPKWTLRPWARRSRRQGVQRQALGVVEIEGGMGRHHHPSTAGAMRGDSGGKELHRGMVEAERGLVEQPEFGRRGGEAGERQADRKSVVSGKSVSVRGDLGGRRFIKKKNKQK